MLFEDTIKISLLLGIEKGDIVGNSPLDNWLLNLCDKNYAQLNCDDVTKMLHQNIGVEIAIVKAFELLSINPLCGIYDWQLFNTVIECDEKIKQCEGKLLELFG